VQAIFPQNLEVFSRFFEFFYLRKELGNIKMTPVITLSSIKKTTHLISYFFLYLQPFLRYFEEKKIAEKK